MVVKERMNCEKCKYCRFPRTANDNWGACKCAAMKYKTIDVSVCEGETPDWCPLNHKPVLTKKNGINRYSWSCFRCEYDFGESYPDFDKCPKCDLSIQKRKTNLMGTSTEKYIALLKNNLLYGHFESYSDIEDYIDDSYEEFLKLNRKP